MKEVFRQESKGNKRKAKSEVAGRMIKNKKIGAQVEVIKIARTLHRRTPQVEIASRLVPVFTYNSDEALASSRHTDDGERWRSMQCCSLLR